jgi:DNA-binding NarL/FixJ family response regulator
MGAYRILVADDHEVVRHGLRALLEKQAGWQVCGEAADGEEAVTKVLELKPDLAVLDIGMPGLNGLAAARKIVVSNPTTKVLILSLYESEQMVREVLQSGARGYLLKSDASRFLVNAAEAIRYGKTYFTPRYDHLVRPSTVRHEVEAKPSVISLTPREQEVARLLGEGKSTREVAQTLNMAIKTAETHRAHIMQKLDLHSITDLVMYAVRNRLVPITEASVAESPAPPVNGGLVA